MAGRKKLYEPELLNIGDRIEIKGAKKAFAHQYAYNWGKRLNKRKIDTWSFVAVTEGNKVFIEREF